MSTLMIRSSSRSGSECQEQEQERCQGQRQEHESVPMVIQPYFVAIHTTIVRCALCIWSWQYSVSPPSARHASLATRN
jgi:hypothetical protein